MSNFHTERVVSVHHWTDRLFSFRTTRSPGLRFRSGQFVMMGLPDGGQAAAARLFARQRALTRMALEFFSIKVPERPADLAPAASQRRRRSAGRPQADRHAADRQPASRAAICSCSAPAPASRPISAWSRTPRPTSVSSASSSSTACASSAISPTATISPTDLPRDELIGELAAAQLTYYPTVTREPFRHNGRISTLLESGKLHADLGLPGFDRAEPTASCCAAARR